MTDIKLNLGCSVFKINGLTNIDLDPNVSPDLVLDLMDLDKHYSPNSVDYIQAGHIFEHFVYEDSLKLMEKCRTVLKPLRNLLVIVPDYQKVGGLSDETADRIILGHGHHKMLCSAARVKAMLKKSGFHHVIEITDLKDVPFIIVPDRNNPSPEAWQTAFVAFKLF